MKTKTRPARWPDERISIPGLSDSRELSLPAYDGSYRGFRLTICPKTGETLSTPVENTPLFGDRLQAIVRGKATKLAGRRGEAEVYRIEQVMWELAKELQVAFHEFEHTAA